MNSTVVLGGDLENIILDGTAELLNVQDGSPGVVTAIREGAFPEYTGEYEITPGTQDQTLNTANTSVLADIVVKAIPNNYGLITWNGSTLTVS